MDSTKRPTSADRRNQRFQQYKDRSNDALNRYSNHLPMQQARESQETLQLIQRMRNQPTKPNIKPKQYDMHKQLLNSSGEQTNNTTITNINGGFNNNNDMLQVIK